MKVSILVSLLAMPTTTRRVTRLGRRQRIRAMLGTHLTTAQPQSLYQHYRPTLPPIFNMWVTWDPAWRINPTPGRRSTLARSTTERSTTTKSTTLVSSQPEAWYYRDDYGQVQGPYSSSTMLGWEQGGYFR